MSATANTSTANTSTATSPSTLSEFGSLLRYWREVRRTSQLELASEAGTTPRHVSFVETGRAQPSRHMVLRLARALDVPLRERNDLLLAAGYAPVYTLAALDSPELARVDTALRSILERHDPLPAIVIDRGWNVLRANDGAATLFATVLAPDPVPHDANVLRLVVEPGRVRDSLRNWKDAIPALLDRARREAVGGVLDPATEALLRELRARPEVAELLAAPQPRAGAPVIDIQFAVAGREVGFFSVVSTIGTPIDVTAQEIRIETFFPSDEASRVAWLDIASRLDTGGDS
jgi:transcriptional regulator with XRE-family HTH domain